MPTDRLKITCPAKVNLALSVGAPDPHTKLHAIYSWMVAVEFGDSVTLTRTNGKSSCAVRQAADAPTGIAIDWPIEKDLAYLAHWKMEDWSGPHPVDILVEKRIPPGSGLGGGSSDAAGVLVGLDRMYAKKLYESCLNVMGLEVGSDVGFLIEALNGNTSAIVSGWGERIVPVSLQKEIDMVLIFPPCHCATAEVYRRFDEIASEPSLQEDRVNRLVNDQSGLGDGLFNDLAEPAFQVQPALRDWHSKLKTVLKRPVHVSGSGASMFIIAESASEAEAIRERVINEVKLPAVATVARG